MDHHSKHDLCVKLSVFTNKLHILAYFLLSLFAVPSVPLNLSYVNVTASSIRLFWDAPNQPNGILLSYRVTYTEEGTERVVTVDDIDPGRESECLLVEPLMEYHGYEVVVAASTDKGFGNYSLPLNVLTEEHGTCMC